MASIDALAYSLNETLTPSGTPMEESRVQVSAGSFGATIVGQFLQTLNWSQAQIDMSSNLFTIEEFANGIAFRYLDNIVEKSKTSQYILTASQIISYIDDLTFMLNCLTSFIKVAVDETSNLINGQTNDDNFQAALVSLVEFAQLAQVIVAHYDVEVPQITDIIQLQQLGQNMNMFFDGLVHLVNQAGELRNAIFSGNQDNIMHQTTYAKTVDTINQIIPQLIKALEMMKHQISEHNVDLFTEPPYAEFHRYISDFVSHSSFMVYVSLIVSFYNKSKSAIVLAVLTEFMNRVFTITSKTTRLMRFRGKFESDCSDIRKAKEELGSIFKPLLEALVDSVPLCPIAFKEPAEKTLVETFVMIQKLHNDFDTRFNALIEALRKDRRFSVFLSVGDINASEVTAEAVAIIENSSSLLCQLFNPTVPIAEAAETIQKVSDGYQSFIGFITTAINNEPSIERRARYTAQCDVITLSMTSFAEQFATFMQQPDNFLLRFKSGVYASDLALATLSLDPHPVIQKNLVSVKQALSGFVVNFFTKNLKVIVELLTLFDSKADTLNPTIQPAFQALFNFARDVIMESSPKFAASTDPANSEHILTCLHEGDKVYTVLTALTGILSIETPADLAVPLSLLQIIAQTLDKGNSSLRYALQLMYQNEASAIIRNLVPFFDIVMSVASLQDDEFFNKFSSRRDKTMDHIDDLAASLASPPPFGVFSAEYFNQLVAQSYNIILGVRDIILDIQPLLKQASCPPQMKNFVKQIMISINSITELNKYTTATRDTSIKIPSLVGFGLKSSIAEAQVLLNNFVQLMASDPASAASSVFKIVKTLYNIAEAFGFSNETAELANGIREEASKLERLTVLFSLGQTDVQNELVQTIQGVAAILSSLTQVSDNLVMLATKQASQETAPAAVVVGEVSAPQSAEFDAAKAIENLVQTGAVVGTDGQPIQGLLVQRIPTEKELNEIFMATMGSANVEGIRGPLSKYADNMKKLAAEFRRTYVEYLKNPSPELIQQMNEISNRINEHVAAIQAGVQFDQSAANYEVANAMQANIADPRAEADKLAWLMYTMSAAINKTEEGARKDCLLQALNSASDEIMANPAAALARVQTIQRIIDGESAEIAVNDLLKLLRESVAKKDRNAIKDILPRLLTAASIFRQQKPAKAEAIVSPIKRAEEIATALIARDDLLQEDLDQLLDIINKFEEAFYEEEPKDDMQTDAEISDHVIDLNQEITAILAQINTDLKKATPGDEAKIALNVSLLNNKAFEIVSATLTAANRRASSISKDDETELFDEIKKLFTVLDTFDKACKESLSAANKSAATRAVNKAQRDVTMSISQLSSLCDTIFEAEDKGEQQPTYRSSAIDLLSECMKMAKSATSATAEQRQITFKKAVPSLQTAVSDYKGRGSRIVAGTDASDEIASMLDQLEKAIDKFTAENISLSAVSNAVNIAIDSKQAIDDALNTDVVPQPHAVASLPFRFSAAVATSSEPRPIAQLYEEIKTASVNAEKALADLNAKINNTKTQADDILAALSLYHCQINSVLLPAEHLRHSTWNPACQNRLSLCHATVVNAGDSAIDAARARLLGSDNWRNTASDFAATAAESLKALLSAAEASFNAAQQDLSATNEAERELISAAQAIQKSQERLTSFKAQAQVQSQKVGASYVGVDIIDVSAPILNSAAKLIEAAQAQTKFLLAREPDLPNTKGLVNTASALVDSLELILVAAESIVANEPDAISKVLAACNLISSAIAHFYAEVHQKNGSPELNEVMKKITDQIQDTIKHVRAFGEEAQRKQTEEMSQGPQRPARALNSMIEKLNAEAKVVEARKLLENAEANLKRARQNK